MAVNNEIRYLNPPTVEVKKKKYCRFKKAHIKYVDYEKILPFQEGTHQICGLQGR